MTLARTAGYPITDCWIALSIALYVLIVLFWLWLAFGFPAFGAVAAIFWLMIARPEVTWSAWPEKARSGWNL